MTASPRGEANCSLRPGGEGGATRRMRASLTVCSYEIQSNCTKSQLVGRCAHTPPLATTYRETSPHQSLRDSFSGGRSRLAAAYRLCFGAELKSKRPTAVLKYRNLFAVSCFGGDVQILCAYHKVLMYNRLIYAFFSALIKREIFTALYA